MGEISMKVNSTLVFILIIVTLFVIHTYVHSYSTVTLALGWSELGLILWPSHILLKCFHLLSWSCCIILHLRCLKVTPRSYTIMCIYGRDYCHYLYRKTELWYNPRNSPSQFICLELLHLLPSHLHPLTRNSFIHTFLNKVSSLFIIGNHLLSQAFAPPQLGAYAIALLSILACIEKFFTIVFFKSIKDIVLYNLHTVSALSFTRNTSSYCTYCLIIVLCWILHVPLHNLHMPLCNFSSLDFL
jgi:hypothetical protein